MSFPDYPLVFYPFAILAILLAGIAKGGFGAAAGGLAVPLMSVVISPPEAAGILLPILCAMDVFSVYAFRGRWSVHHLRILLPGSIAGIALGSFAFGLLSVNAIRFLVGFVAVLFSLNKWFSLSERLARLLAVESKAPGRLSGLLCGLVSGFTSTLAHAGGPPFAVYIYAQKLDKTLIVATSAAFFCIGNYTKLVPYYFLGQLNASNLGTSLLFAPLAPLGVWLGLWLHRRVSEQAFFQLSYTLLFLSGVKLIADSLAN